MRILIVEDEQNIASYIEQSLKAEGFSVDVAYDGNTALDKALANEYDAITLDILLPGMNGYAVCKEIRSAGITTPVLMLTAKDGEYDEADALDIGADDFLRKPFSVVVLAARIRALIRRGGSAHGTTLTVGGLEVDPKQKSVVCDGENIELTPREFALLEYLMHHEGQTLSKTQLLEHVWGHSYAGDENVVEVYVGYLRRKLNAASKKKYLHTVRGVGYKLEEE